MSPHPVEIGTTRVASLNNVRALVTTKWKRGYSKKVIRQVESFYLDSSLDNDADSFQIQIGDPTGEYLAMMERNNEVRMEILSTDPKYPGHLMTGIADDLTFDQDGSYSITGRDYASLALDSTCPGQIWKKVKPRYIIANQARKLGFPGVSLNEHGAGLHGMVKKVVKTDGSETYWEFWYRLYRNEKMYLWVNPNGTLIGNRLYYTDQPHYYFGQAMSTDNQKVREMHLPIEGVEIRKSTQGRVAECWVYAHNGKDSWIEKSGTSDPTISDWIKRPFKLIQDTTSHSRVAARKRAWEEIYESKVGSFEIKILIANPNYVIQSNRMCRIRIPELDIMGTYFIVGTRIQAGPTGYVQEIRLREKEIALSRRVPTEPKIKSTLKKPPALTTPDHQYPWEAAENASDQLIATIMADSNHPEWADYFWKAAFKWRGSWDFDTFLAWILATAYVETGIHNIREYGMRIGIERIEWYAPAGTTSTGQDVPRPGSTDWPRTWGFLPEGPAPTWGFDPKHQPETDYAGRRHNFEMNFANEKGTHGLHKEAGVGPMQLTSRGLKEDADDYFDGFAPSRNQSKVGHNEYFGGRWHPEANIWIGAEFFKYCLDQSGFSPADDETEGAMQVASYKYNHGPSSAYQPGNDYVAKVRKAVNVDPGFLKLVNAASAQVKTSEQAQDGYTEGSPAGEIIPYGWPSPEQCVAAFSGQWNGPQVTTGTEGLPPIKFLQAKQYRPNRLAPINYIVIHTMEMPLSLETAENCANMFATSTRIASAHYCLDAKSIYQSVRDTDVAYGSCGTIGPTWSVNDQALHFEHAGYAGSTNWGEPFALEMLKMSAKLTAQKAKRYGIPMVKLTSAEVGGGIVHGFCGHKNLTEGLGLTGDCAHTDPGDDFPWTQYMQWVNEAA